MNKRTLLGLFMSVLLLGACNFAGVQGSGRIISESRTVTAFNRVSICCGMQLTLKQGAPAALTITADDNILPNIESVISNSALTVRFKQSAGTFGYRTTKPIQVNVTMPTVQGIDLSGGSTAQAGNLETNALQLTSSGGSQATISTLNADTLTLDISGGGGATIDKLNGKTVSIQSSGGSQAHIGAGVVTGQTIVTSGGGGYDAGGLQSETVNITMSGGGTATIWATETLNVQLNGGSTARYYGTPKLTQNLSGGSQLKALGER